jgi:hypothetical protein
VTSLTLRQIANRFRQYFNKPIIDALREYTPPDAASQLALSLTYHQLAASGATFPPLHDIGFKVYSQTDEDGILLFIFSIIGATNKRCVEICAGNGIECNTANLIINHGWIGLLFDGDPDLVRQGKEFYRANRATFVDPPAFVCSRIKRDNINALLCENGFQGEIDLLSLDMDGVDYWIWETIEVIRPRVVVLEYQDIIGPDKSLTVPYADNFYAYEYPTTRGMPNFCGASLSAFVKLAKRKGYRLVGSNRFGYNAFFIKNNIGDKEVPEIPVADCFKHPKVLWGMKHRWPTVKDFPWVEV